MVMWEDVMKARGERKFNLKLFFSKLVLFGFVLLLLFTYSRRETDNQTFELYDSAFLYEGNQLVGVNVDERAEELATAQANRAAEVMEEHADDKNPVLSTKVISTPSIVKFTLTDQEQVSTIDYAKQKTEVLDQGYTLTIDGKEKYYIKSSEQLDWVIKKILLAYLPDQSYLDYYAATGKFKEYTIGSRTFTGITINNDIKISEGYTTGSTYVENQEDLLFELFHKNQHRDFDVISDDKSIKTIKEENDLSDTVFKLNNPEVADDSLTYNGQKLVTNDLDPVLDIVQTFETTKTEEVEFDTVQKVDDDLLTGQFKVENEGKNGEKEITYENKMVNGEVVSTEKVSEEVTVKPEHKVILVGEKPVTNVQTVAPEGDYTPSSASSSGFIWPSSGSTVTCEYQCYPNHTGMDIQSYKGGPIYAAQSGVVVTSGWSPYGYGYHVVIDHGNGVQTLYAHQMVQPPVSVGQYVEQGQVIGFEGSTGNVQGATGVHLHFEVRINGSTVNPRGYV